jgi:hypothetical protein
MARIATSEIERIKSDVSLVRLIEGACYTLKPQGRDLGTVTVSQLEVKRRGLECSAFSFRSMPNRS